MGLFSGLFKGKAKKEEARDVREHPDLNEIRDVEPDDLDDFDRDDPEDDRGSDPGEDKSGEKESCEDEFGKKGSGTREYCEDESVEYESGEESEEDDDEDEDSEPVRTLYTSKKLMSLHSQIDIADENDEIVYRASSKAASLKDSTLLYRCEDLENVARITKKVISLHEVHYVEMENGRSFELSSEIVRVFQDSVHIEGLGWELEGDLTETNYDIWDEESNLIASVEHDRFSIHDKYMIEIYHTEFEEEVVAILVTLQHMIRDRERSRDFDNVFGTY